MSDESPIQNDNYTDKSVVLVSRNQNEPLPVQLEDGKTIVGDSTANSGIDQVAVPVPDGDDTHFLNGDGEWTVPAGGGGGVSQQGWSAVMQQSADLNEVTSSIPLDWTGAHAGAVSNSVSEGVLPSWIVNDDATPTLIHLDKGTYIVTVGAAFTNQDSLGGATAAGGLTGESFTQVSRAGGGSTTIATLSLSGNTNTDWDPAVPTVRNDVSYLVSIPSTAGHQKFKVTTGVNVSDLTFFVNAVVDVTVTRIG